MPEQPGENKDNKDQSVTPNNALLNILGNALKSSMKYSQAAAAATTRKCSGCGAARPADTNLEVCDFCGNPFN